MRAFDEMLREKLLDRHGRCEAGWHDCDEAIESVMGELAEVLVAALRDFPPRLDLNTLSRGRRDE